MAMKVGLFVGDDGRSNLDHGLQGMALIPPTSFLMPKGSIELSMNNLENSSGDDFIAQPAARLSRPTDPLHLQFPNQHPSATQAKIFELPTSSSAGKRRRISSHEQKSDVETGSNTSQHKPTATVSCENSTQDENSAACTTPRIRYQEKDSTGYDDDESKIRDNRLSDGVMPCPSFDLTESIMAKRMAKLSMKDREAVYYDIHGVTSAIDEDAEEGFLERKINEMSIELDKIDNTEKVAYNMARSVNESYVDAKDFRLRFLRADRFDTKLAASRYVRFFEAKLKLFGRERIAQDIVQDDLGEEALDALYSGIAQLLPRRDNAGRLVVVWKLGSNQQQYSVQALCRRMFYVAMMVSEDVEAQRKGVVGVLHALQRDQQLRGSGGLTRVQNLANTITALPMSVVTLHFGYESLAWMPAVAAARVSCDLFLQLRFRAHYGSHAELLASLQTFGIPADTIPINEKGKICVNYHRRFLENRRTQERQRTNDDTEDSSSSRSIRMTIPKNCDILLGRGKGYFNHVGNIKYRNIIEDNKEKYDRETKEGRQKVAEGIVAIVHGYGGRFLKDDGDGVWVRIDDKSARRKVSHSFRALRSASHRINNAPSMKRIQRD